MKVLEIIKNEFENVSSWTDMLINNIDDQLWNTTLQGIETNFNWLIGHIVHDKYFHAIACITKIPQSLLENFSIINYQRFYRVGTSPTASLTEKPETPQLRKDLQTIDNTVFNVLNDINDKNLREDTLLDNPVANTKYEALMWAIKHQMWHNGQIALIKRILNTQS